MKLYRFITALLISLFLSGMTTSCVVVAKTDNGKHKGWYKNTNNPHHPTTTNPGKAKGKKKF